MHEAACNFTIPQDKCTLETCCLAQGSFTYRPSLGGNLFFAIFFGVFMIPQLGLGIRYRTWGFMIGMLLGLAQEVIGYASRVWLHDNPFSNDAFLIYLILLTIAPVFMSAAIYLTITRVILLYGQHLFWVPARFVALAFMTSDLLSLVLQAAGGAIAESNINTDHASTDGNTSGTGTGKTIMIVGLFLQAVSLGVFAALWALFMLRVWRGVPDPDPAKAAVRGRPYFAISQVGLLVATAAVLARSIFRVVELWGGFSGPVWNDGVDFMVLDGGLIGLATLLLTALHPGPAFGEQWHIPGFRLRDFKVWKRENRVPVSRPGSDDGDIEKETGRPQGGRFTRRFGRR